MSGPGEHEWVAPGAGPGAMRTSDVLIGFVDEIQDLRRRLLGSTINDVPGRTADVKEFALLRLQQVADTMSEEAVSLERVGE